MTEEEQQDRSRQAVRRNLKRALSEIDRVAEKLSIPDETVSTATRVYRELLQQSSDDRMYGWSIEVLSVASLYIACKVDRIPRNAEEFVEASEVSEKQLLRRSKTIRSQLDLDVEGFTDPNLYVERYCDELGLSDDIAQRAKQVIEYAQEAGVTAGKSLQGQAAAAVYIAGITSGASVTQSELSSIADVTEVTIRNRYQEQAEVLRIREEPPDDPGKVVDWFGNLTGIDPKILDRARSILSCGREADEPVQNDSLRWGLGAIRLASEEADDPVSKRTLRSISGKESSEIQEAAKELKKDLRASKTFKYRPDGY